MREDPFGTLVCASMHHAIEPGGRKRISRCSHRFSTGTYGLRCIRDVQHVYGIGAVGIHHRRHHVRLLPCSPMPLHQTDPFTSWHIRQPRTGRPVVHRRRGLVLLQVAGRLLPGLAPSRSRVQGGPMCARRTHLDPQPSLQPLRCVGKMSPRVSPHSMSMVICWPPLVWSVRLCVPRRCNGCPHGSQGGRSLCACCPHSVCVLLWIASSHTCARACANRSSTTSSISRTVAVGCWCLHSSMSISSIRP
jgi:hypothetical protein